MRIFLNTVLVLHGLIHLLGFVRGFELAVVSQLKLQISPIAGGLWLLAALLLLGSAILLGLRNPSWWLPAAAGIALSQGVIINSWSDAGFGTIVNVLLLLPVAGAALNILPSSYLNQFRAEVQHRLASPPDAPLLTEADIQHLPPPVQSYLRFSGSVGAPRIVNFRAEMKGTMRRGADGDWITIHARQYNFFDDPARLFFIESSLYGIPFDGYHAYVDNVARMRVKIGGLLEVVDARGPQMDQAETVTMFNDMCLFAPGTLISPTIRWEHIDSLTVRAVFTNKGHTISAILKFDPSGALRDFLSNDRFLSNDGKTYLNYPWSTPVRGFIERDGRRVLAAAEAIWHYPTGPRPYARFEITTIDFNVTAY
jgi:hypothetical protein